MTKEMFEEITAWQDKTFTKANALSAANHLEEEVGELIKELEHTTTGENLENEYADCFMLLFGSAHKRGYSYQDIQQIIRHKFEIAQTRKWGEINDKGYVRHVD